MKNTFRPVSWLEPDWRPQGAPAYVMYRRRARRVYGIVPTRHGGHRHFVLKYRRNSLPLGAATMAFGPRGRVGVVAVLVRSDHVRPYRRRVAYTGRRGRPRRKMTGRTA